MLKDGKHQHSPVRSKGLTMLTKVSWSQKGTELEHHREVSFAAMLASRVDQQMCYQGGKRKKPGN